MSNLVSDHVAENVSGVPGIVSRRQAFDPVVEHGDEAGQGWIGTLGGGGSAALGVSVKVNLAKV